jgi:DNA-binding CsgD family transcriptional regulator
MSHLYPMRGRDGGIEAIHAALDRVSRGVGDVTLIEGQPGIGKTRLLTEARSIAERLGFRTGFGAGRQGEEIVELSALMDAICGGDVPLVDFAKLSKLVGSPEQRYWVLHDVQSLLERAAMETPLMVCLDDLQWADSGTAAALRVLPQCLSTLPISWVLAIRPHEGSVPMVSALTELADGGARRISLGPIDREAVTQIAADVLGAKPGQGVLQAAERAAGNPFLLVELLLGLKEENLVSSNGRVVNLTADRLPGRVGNTMSQRIKMLSPPAERIIIAAASLGQRFSMDELSQIADMPVGELLGPVDELIRADLLSDEQGRLTFRHDLIRDGVRAACSNSVRRALDRRAAGVLLDRGAVPVEVASQLAQSAEPGDDDAIATLLKAAEALAMTDPAASADLAQKALDLTPPRHRLRGPLVSRTVVSLFAAGRTAEAKAFADVALRQALPPEQEAQVRLGICRMFYVSSDVQTYNARKALALPALSIDMRAWLWSHLFHNLVVAGRTSEALEIEAEVAEAVYASSSRAGWFPYELAKAAAEYQASNFDRALALLGEAEAHRVEGSDDTRDVAFRCHVYTAMDRPDEALDVADQAMVAAQRDRQNWALNVFDTWKGRQLFQMGRLAEAATLLQGRYTVRDAHLVTGVPDASALVAFARVRQHMGDTAAPAEAAEIAKVLLQIGVPMIQRHGAWLLALHSASLQQPTQAYDWICTFGEDTAPEFLPLFPFEATDDVELVRIAVNARQPQLAKRATQAAQVRAEVNPTVRTLRAVAAHCAGLTERSSDRLLDAVRLYDGTSRPLWQASAFEDLGDALVGEGATTEAVEAYDQSLRAALACGAASDAARVRQRLARLGVRRRVVQPRRPRLGWEALTESEVGIAELVTAGLSNREIGERLFISPHTVGTHVRHIFQKLGVNSRVALTKAVQPGQLNGGQL